MMKRFKIRCGITRWCCVHLNIYFFFSLPQVRWSLTCGSCRSRWWPTSCTTTGSRPPSLYPPRLLLASDFLYIFTFRHCVISPSFCSIQDQDRRLQALHSACEKLPPANNNNFKWVSVLLWLCSSGLTESGVGACELWINGYFWVERHRLWSVASWPHAEIRWHCTRAAGDLHL